MDDELHIRIGKWERSLTGAQAHELMATIVLGFVALMLGFLVGVGYAISLIVN